MSAPMCDSTVPVGHAESHLTGHGHPIQPIKVRGKIYVDYTYG